MHFRVLGPLEVDAGDGPIPLGGPKQRAVLANLLVRANQVVPADTLIDDVWGEEPPEQARNTLQTYVSNLRRTIGDDRLQGRPPGYVLLLESFEFDAARFDSLVRDAKTAMSVDPGVAVSTLDDALDLWRGPALADLTDQVERSSLVAEAARLDDRKLQAQEQRVEGLLASGDSARAASEATLLVATHPLRESLRSLQMLALYRAGRQADALNAFQRTREILADELGIDPSPELARLHERVLQQDPGLDLKGEPLRGYRLLEKLGEGPEGAVFRAIQPQVGRDVAVKVFRERVASDVAFVQRFERDAQAVAALEHPHIVPIYDYWREPSGTYLVSRYLRGGSLRTLEERGEHLNPARALRVFEQVADALTFAHQRNVVHGALGRSNVLFDGEGNPYVGDFLLRAEEEGTVHDDVASLALLANDLLGGSMPERLQELVALTEIGDSGVDAAMLTDAARLASQPGSRPTQAASLARNPYKGLRAFDEPDAVDFFGRRSHIGRLVERLREHGPGARFLAIVGPSGGGKSSVVRAGLLPAIRRGELPGPPDRFIAEMLPGAHPIEELEAALLRIAVEPVARLNDLLRSGSRGLLDAVTAIVQPDAEVVLLVDQFEEVFTLTSNERDRELFLESLRVASVDPESRVRILVTLRADFFDRPLVYPRFGELLAARSEPLPPLTPDEMEQAIRRPVERLGITPDPELEAAVIADVAHQPGGLPLLQYALTELFERRTDGRMTLASYRDIGGVAGALSMRAERLYLEADEHWRRTVRQVFLRLVTLGDGTHDTRRRVPRTELDTLDAPQAMVDEILDTFGSHRLLTFDREPSTREPTVEIAHEALLGAWNRLRAWIDEAREDLRQERSLTQAAADWHAADRDSSFLLEGARLEQIEDWAAATDLSIGRLARSYLKASLDRRDREREAEEERQAHEVRLERRSRTRLRSLVALFAVAALVAATLTIIATDQSDRAGAAARVATARELAAASVANLEIDAELSILLAREAIEETRSVDGSVLREAEEALHRAIVGSRYVDTIQGVGGKIAWSRDGKIVGQDPQDAATIEVRSDRTGEVVSSFPGHEGGLTDAAFSPDGSLLSTTGEDGGLHMQTPDGGHLWRSRGFGPANGLSFSADGSRVAAAWTDEAVVRVFDPATGHVLSTIQGIEAYETALAPDGDRIAIATADGPGVVIDLASGTEAYPPLEVEYGVHTVAWSPDGRYLATGGIDRLAFLWDAATGDLLSRLYGHTVSIEGVAWSPDSTRLAAVSGDGLATIWDIGSIGREGIRLVSTTGNGLWDVAFSSDGERVMTSESSRSSVSIWDVGITGSAEIVNLAAVRHYGSVEFLDDGRHVVAVGLDPPTGERTDDLTDGRITIWDVTTGDADAAFGPPVGESYFDVSEDGTTLAAGCSVAWDIPTGGRLFQQDASAGGGCSRYVDEGHWNSDASRLIVQEEGGGFGVVDRQGEMVHPFQEEGIATIAAAFSPDDRLIAASNTFDVDGSSRDVAIWDWRRERVVKSIETDAFALAWDPTSTTIATAGRDATVSVWRLDESTASWTIEVSGSVIDLEFSPDGTTIAMAGADSSVTLVDATTGEEQLVLHGHESFVRSVDFSPDGSMLASQEAGTVRIWALDIDGLLAIADSELTRSLTPDECRRYLHVDSCPT